jgi:DNA polymerase-3 subunit delta
MARASGSARDGSKPVYAVFGPDDFLRRQAIGQIVKTVLGDPPAPMAQVDVDGPQAKLADVLDELRTLPFLADVRLVIVHDADSFISANREALERYVAAPSETGVLVLVCDVMNKQWRLSRAIQQVGQLIECKAPPVYQRPEWLAARARQEYAKDMDGAAARALVDLAGSDMASLDAELAKLAIYVGDRDRISTSDVEDLVGFNRPENVFRMTDAIAGGDAAAALRIWRQTLATDSQAAYRAIGGLAWAVRQMMAAKGGGRAPVGPSTSRSASRFTLEQLQDILVDLLAADVTSKTGLGTFDSAVEKLVVRVCSAKPDRTL